MAESDGGESGREVRRGTEERLKEDGGDLRRRRWRRVLPAGAADVYSG